ncbi:MAG: glycosyltransferase, partial [Bacteroidia bacterium]
DETLAKEIPSDITIIRRPIWEPFSLYKQFTGKKKEEKMHVAHIHNAKQFGKKSWKERLAIWVRGNFFIPDARCFWIRPSVNFLSQYLKEHPVDAIVSTGPPHSMHLIALGVKKRLGIPWLADFRDPWREYFEALDLSQWARRKHEKLENEVLTSADAVTVVGRKMKEDHHAIAGIDSVVIYNGFDPADFETVKEVKTSDDKFLITHSGNFSARRNLPEFWRALRKFMNDTPAFAEKLELRLMGTRDESITTSLKENDLEKYAPELGYVKHDKVVYELKRATVLLLFVDRFVGSKWILTGKLPEYLAANRPILNIGPLDGDLAQEIELSKAGINVPYDDEKAIYQALAYFWEKFQAGGLHQHQTQDFSRFSRVDLAGKMADLLTKISTPKG